MYAVYVEGKFYEQYRLYDTASYVAELLTQRNNVECEIVNWEGFLVDETLPIETYNR